jgi:hypothetical protein
MRTRAFVVVAICAEVSVKALGPMPFGERASAARTRRSGGEGA